MLSRKIRVLFIPIGGEHLTHSRLRVYNYFSRWDQYDIEAQVTPWRENINRASKSKLAAKIAEQAREFDIVYLYRAFLPKRCLQKIRENTKLMVWDYDDAVYSVPSIQCSPVFASANAWSERIKQIYRKYVRGNRFHSARKSHLDFILRQCHGVVAGNSLLANYASNFTPNHTIAPTPVDIWETPLKAHGLSHPVIIGWTGTPDGIYFLESHREAFRKLGEKYGNNIRLKIVSQPRSINIPGISIDFKQWTLEQDKSVLQSFDIGIMPLSDDGWSRGKCGYKALLCIAAGLPTVVSPVGINAEIIQDGENGFHASTDAEWVEKLSLLIEDLPLRRRLGACGRKTVEEKYSRPVMQSRIAEFLHALYTQNLGQKLATMN